jgi:hypothetical protein
VALLQAGDHRILQMLCNELLPWMIGGRQAHRQWFVRLAIGYAYGGELATALAGLGIGAPLVAAFQGKIAGGSSALDILHKALPGFWFWIGLGALIVWLVVRIVVQQQKATSRALFAVDCSKTMQKLYADLFTTLTDENPLPNIAPIKEAVMRAVKEAIEKDVWPWNPPQPKIDDINSELYDQVNDIRNKFMARWAPISGDQRP